MLLVYLLQLHTVIGMSILTYGINTVNTEHLGKQARNERVSAGERRRNTGTHI